MSQIWLLVCRFGVRNALFILSGKWVLHAMWHWIWNMKQQLLPPPPPPLLERAWSFPMDRGSSLPLGMHCADAQEYFACIMTMLRLQRRWVGSSVLVLALLASHSWFFPGVFLGRQLGLVSLPLIFTAGRRRGWRERYNVLKLLSTQGWNPQVSTKPLTTCCCSMRISVGKMFSLEEPPRVLGFGVICRRRGQLCLQAPWRLRWFLTTLLLPVPS